MIVCLNHRLIFLANPRCASTSLRRTLDSYSQIKGGESSGLSHHACMRSVEAHLRGLGHDPDAFDVFTTIRNPWARVVSIYEYGLSNPKSIWHAPATTSGTFAAFCFHPILRHVFKPMSSTDRHPEGPFDIVSFGTDAAGNFRPVVFDVDNLAHAEMWLDARGIQASIPRLNGTAHPPYREVYDERARAEIKEIFNVDIHWGPYAF